MNKMKTVILILCVLICFIPLSNLIAQHDNIWVLGYGNSSTIPKPAIDFLGGSADTFAFPRPMQFFTTNSSMSNNQGQLLFYTNGHYIENANSDTLLNSQNYNPGWLTSNGPSLGLGVTQGVLSLPFPGDTNKFILFHVSGEPYNYQLPSDTTWYPSVQPMHLGYTVVDMTLDGGLGGVPIGQKNVYAISDTLFLGWITACKHGNGRDWWVVVHKWYSDIFYLFLVDPQGVNSPVIQQAGPVMMPSDGLRDFDRAGQSVFSPDGSKLALAGQSNILHLFDFDRCTGNLSNHRSALIDTLDRVQGCSFSPDSRFLYVSHFFNLYQFDTSQPNLSASGIIVAQYDSFVDPLFNLPQYFFSHQLAPDGKIYIAPFNGSLYLHYINFPNSFGFSSDFIQHSFVLPNYSIGLPNFPNYNLGSLVGSPCDTLTSISEAIQNSPLRLKVFPNPVVAQTISIQYTLEQNKKGWLEILDITGKTVFEQTLPQWSTMQELPLQGLSGGVYVLKLKSGSKEVTTKLIIIKE